MPFSRILSSKSFITMMTQCLKQMFYPLLSSPRCFLAFTTRTTSSAVGASLTMTTWWRYQMETISALLALCEWNSPVTGEFPSQRPVTRSFDFFFDLRLNKRLSKQQRRWWFETPSCSLWRHCNEWHHSASLYESNKSMSTFTTTVRPFPGITSKRIRKLTRKLYD